MFNSFDSFKMFEGPDMETRSCLTRCTSAGKPSSFNNVSFLSLSWAEL